MTKPVDVQNEDTAEHGEQHEVKNKITIDKQQWYGEHPYSSIPVNMKRNKASRRSR